MIAKKSASQYFPGKRTGGWLKIKSHQGQEAVIAGFTEPRGSRKYFGALVLGVYHNGELKYTGHTGTGFADSLLRDLYNKMKPLVTTKSRFAEKIKTNATVTWLKPKLVANIRFTELTKDGQMRHPVFQGLRIDKVATEVKKEIAMPAKKTLSSKKKNEQTDDKEIKVDGHIVQLTNQKKLYWPKEKITKGDVIEYYNSIHKFIIPYLKERPQSLKRNPNGILDDGFFHKDAGDDAPPWVKTKSIYSESANKNIDYIICNDKATLLYLNNLGCIELNPWNSRITNPDKPDYLVIDIDPSEKNSFDEVIEVALTVKEILQSAGIKGYCKTSGASGLHVYIPLAARYTYDEVRDFAKIIAVITQERLPSFTSIERSLIKRKGKIYIDYLQNKRGQTLACAYCLRPRIGATASTPLDWKEVKKGLRPIQFTIQSLPARLEKVGDLFRPVLSYGIDLNKGLAKLEHL